MRLFSVILSSKTSILAPSPNRVIQKTFSVVLLMKRSMFVGKWILPYVLFYFYLLLVMLCVT